MSACWFVFGIESSSEPRVCGIRGVVHLQFLSSVEVVQTLPFLCPFVRVWLAFSLSLFAHYHLLSLGSVRRKLIFASSGVCRNCGWEPQDDPGNDLDHHPPVCHSGHFC